MPGRFPILDIAEADAEEAVLSSGALAQLVEAIPQATFTVVGSPASAPLFADLPRLQRLITLDRDGRWDWIALWNQVRETNWGLVVDMRGSTLSGKLRRQRRAVKGKPLPGVHLVEQAARTLQLDEIPAPRLFIGRDTQEAADALIPAGDGPILAIGPGADWIGKRWPADRYAKIANSLLGPGGPAAGGRRSDPGDRTGRGLDRQALAGRSLRQDRHLLAGRGRAAGRRAADDRGRGGGPRRGPDRPLGGQARPGDRTAGTADAVADGGRPVARDPLSGRRLPVDPAGRGGGRSGGGGLRPFG